jgi:hypothetical protein
MATHPSMKTSSRAPSGPSHTPASTPSGPHATVDGTAYEA